MARRLPKSERSPSLPPPPPSDQRDAAIQELSKGSELATQLMAQLELIPERELDGRRDDALANVRSLSMSLSSSLYALRSERREHHNCGSSSSSGGAGPAAVTSVSGGGRGGGSGARNKTKRRRGKHGEELTETVFITTTPENDGFHWRKYGEKKILDSEFRKLYYRCGYSDERKCQAKKYVQQENNKHPPEFRVTLTNEHTCNTLFQDQPSSSSTNSQVLDFTKASISSPLMDSHVGATILKKEEEEEVPSIDESSRIMSTIMRNYGAYGDYDESSPQSWNGAGWQ
uniref:WRKY domain-containing protein n=1 Tax=Oryza nivara TaxID=4536 RepID=A0A0E0HG17_ORYNI